MVIFSGLNIWRFLVLETHLQPMKVHLPPHSGRYNNAATERFQMVYMKNRSGKAASKQPEYVACDND